MSQNVLLNRVILIFPIADHTKRGLLVLFISIDFTYSEASNNMIVGYIFELFIVAHPVGLL